MHALTSMHGWGWLLVILAIVGWGWLLVILAIVGWSVLMLLAAFVLTKLWRPLANGARHAAARDRASDGRG